MKQVFINPQTQKLRAGWQILVFILILGALNAILIFGIRSLLGSLKGGGILSFTILGFSATVAALLTTKYIAKESFQSLGLNWNRLAIWDILGGIICSALIMAALYFLMLITGLIEFQGLGWWTETTGPNINFSWAVVPVILGVIYKLSIVAWWEELAFRGIIFQNMIKGMGLNWAILLSCLLFGLVHAGNPNATMLSTLMIILITTQLIYAYLKTGQLWLPMGLHLGWNFFQASIFGYASSGNISPSLIMQKATGPDWLSGGDFGAEGSILIIPFVLGSFFLINWWVNFLQNKNEKLFSFFSQPQ